MLVEKVTESTCQHEGSPGATDEWSKTHIEVLARVRQLHI